jgi:hypothetical protein
LIKCINQFDEKFFLDNVIKSVIIFDYTIKNAVDILIGWPGSVKSVFIEIIFFHHEMLDKQIIF